MEVLFLASKLAGVGQDQPRLGLHERMQSYEWGRTALRYAPDVLASSHLTDRISTAAEQGLYALAGPVVIAVVGVYLGANPPSYEKGLIKLFPGHRQQVVHELLAEVAYALRWWIIGQLIPMAVLGTATIIGLRLFTFGRRSRSGCLPHS